MDISAMAGSAVAVKATQTQDRITLSVMKMEAQQQNRLADLLAQSVQQPAPAADPRYGFSVYA